MTSSFQNVVGTPRDQVPDISNTNYLNTEADMTESVNKEIDDNIKDTKQFFDQMVELVTTKKDIVRIPKTFRSLVKTIDGFIHFNDEKLLLEILTNLMK